MVSFTRLAIPDVVLVEHEYAGLETSDDLTTSAYELRHRFQLFGTYTAPWKRFPTDLSVDASLTSGSPISSASDVPSISSIAM